MNNKSRKAKGRYLQNIVRDKIIENMEISSSIKKRILSGTAFEWLGLNECEFIKS